MWGIFIPRSSQTNALSPSFSLRHSLFREGYPVEFFIEGGRRAPEKCCPRSLVFLELWTRGWSREGRSLAEAAGFRSLHV